MRGQARSFRLDQKIAPRRGLDLLDFLEMSRPCLSRDLKELQEFITDRLARVPGVSNIRSSMALKQVKYKTALPI